MIGDFTECNELQLIKMKLNYFYVFLFIVALTGCAKYEDASLDDNDVSVDIIGTVNQQGENPFVSTSDEAVSTFSVDADGGSYTNCKRYIMNNEYPPTTAVHVEEFINYFPYDYKEPSDDSPISIESELSSCPWNTEHQLLRIGLKGEDFPLEQLAGSNIVLFVDVSGSMSADDKLPLLRKSFKHLLNKLSSKDYLSIVTYSVGSQVHLEPVVCSPENRDLIIDAINTLIAGENTEGAAGITTAYELAEQNFIEGGNNRIILATDDNLNVGINDNNALIRLVKEKREKGIFLSVLGSGRTNLTDAMMEQLAEHGNGDYEYVGEEADAIKIFTNDFKKFYTVAQDVKIELTFNSGNVDQYRLIGFESRDIAASQISQGEEEAGEIGCDQSITALYELIMNENKSSVEVGVMSISYSKPVESTIYTMEHSLNLEINSFETASESQVFSASAACFGMILKQSQYRNNASAEDVLNWVSRAITYDPNDYREEFIDFVTYYKGFE
jgi:Ca-activated chloride channel family protein